MQLLLRNGNYIFHGTIDEKDVPKTAGFRWNSIVQKFWATSDPRIAARLIDVVEMAPEVRSAIDAGIAEVRVSTLDPNPLVNGAGISRLREAGIRTDVGECEEHALRLMEAYLKFVEDLLA